MSQGFGVTTTNKLAQKQKSSKGQVVSTLSLEMFFGGIRSTEKKVLREGQTST